MRFDVNRFMHGCTFIILKWTEIWRGIKYANMRAGDYKTIGIVGSVLNNIVCVDYFEFRT